eukprot:14976333-Alexandrium_andersonii.AAC.1
MAMAWSHARKMCLQCVTVGFVMQGHTQETATRAALATKSWSNRRQHATTPTLRKNGNTPKDDGAQAGQDR